MKNKNLIKKLIFIYIISLVFSFILGFFVTDAINSNKGEYVSTFSYVGDKELDFNNIINEDFLNSVKENHPNLTLEEIDVEKMLKNEDFSIIQNEDKSYTITTKIKYYETSFVSSSLKILNRAETFIKYTLIDFTEDKNSIKYTDDTIGEITNTFSTWLSGLISLGLGMLIVTIVIIILPKKTIKNEENDAYIDGQEVFKNPFNINYWIKSLHELKTTKSIVALAMLFALLMVSKLISLPSGFGDLGINLGYLVLAVICMIYGPIVSLGVGLFSDVLGYFIGTNTYAFNAGYTIQAILAALTYALCLYRTRVTFSKVLLSRIIVNLVLNVLYGSFLMVTIYIQNGNIPQEELLEAYKIYALFYSLPKNLVYLLPQSILLFIIIKTLAPVLERMNFIPKNTSKNISII